MVTWTRRTAHPSARARARALAWLLQLSQVSAALGAGALFAAGCEKPSSENIQLWKTTQKGPDKIREALVDPSVAPRLRAEASAALIDIGRADEADGVFEKIPAEQRAEILKALIPLHEVAMKDPMPGRAQAARDALFALRAFAGGEDQKRIDAALLPAVAADLRSGQLRPGRHSIDKVLSAIGPASGVMLGEVLAEPIPTYPLAAELLGKVGDEAARDKGAVELIARAKKEREKDKDKVIPPSMWKAIGAIGGPVAVKFMQERALGPNRDEAVSAVRALAERRDPAVLPFALKVAGDGKADRLIRDEMFGVIESIGGADARQGLLSIISSDKEELVRYRAFEVVLGTSKSDGIIPALDAFPAGVAYKKVDVDDLLVRLIEKLGAPARPVLVQALDSRAPLTRMTAVMTLEHVGRSADAPALEKLGKDSTSLKGFPAGETIGKEAARVAELVKKKV